MKIVISVTEHTIPSARTVNKYNALFDAPIEGSRHLVPRKSTNIQSETQIDDISSKGTYRDSGEHCLASSLHPPLSPTEEQYLSIFRKTIDLLDRPLRTRAKLYSHWQCLSKCCTIMTMTAFVSPIPFAAQGTRLQTPAVSPRMTAAKPKTQKQPKPVKDIYKPFWDYATGVLESRLPDLSPYPIPDGFVTKEAIVGKGKRAGPVKTDSYAYCTPKLRQIRTAHVQGGAALQVLNFVMFPGMEYDLPFFGADLVTLPGGHLIALDMQPLFHTDDYRTQYSKPLAETFEKHKQNLPWGGDFPEEAARFFSPNFLWSRPQEDELVETHVFAAFKDYLNHYLDFVEKAEPVTDPARLKEIKESQVAYLKYRAEKDPARGMFLRFYGEEWTEEYIHGFLFDLERKIEAGEYTPPV